MEIELMIYWMFGYIILVILYGVIYTKYINYKVKNYKSVFNENGNLEFFDNKYIKPKLITFEFYNNSPSNKYINLAITPFIDITIDKQFTEGFFSFEGETLYGVIEYNISINWLGFVAGITYNRFTNKWMK